MSTLFVEHLTVIDCAYLDAQRGLVGESWIVDVSLDGDLDPQSMVLDFGEVKRRLKRAIDGSVDHSLVVPARAPGLRFGTRSDGRIGLSFATAHGAIEHCAPSCAVTLLDAAEVSPGAVAVHLQRTLAPLVPGNVTGLHLALRTEAIDGPWYHYVHGLKKHAGQCQRIAHGHRSRLKVTVDGVRDPSLEQSLALAWQDIYLGSREDVAAHAGGRVDFAYDAPEGRFELSLPAARVELVDTDTTVECLAEHLLDRARIARPQARQIQIRAYEGVMKGALARLPDTA